MATGVILLFLVAATPLVATTARIAWQSRAKVVNVADKSATNAKASLANAKAAGAKVEFAVRFGAISIGWLAFCIGASRWVLSEADWPVQFFSLMPLWPLGGALMLLSVRPTDKIATFVATPLVQLATLYFGVQLTGAFFLFIRSGAGAVAFPFLLIGGTNIVCSLLLIRNYCVCPGFDKAGSPRVRLNRLWRSYRIFCGAMTPFFFFAAAASAGLLPPPSVPANDPTAASPPPSQPPGRDGGDFTKAFSSSSPINPADAPGAFLCVLVTLLIAAGLKPAVRRRFHAFLGSLAVQGESKAAATVAGLVGGRSPDEALKHGASTFRGLPFGSLSVNDFKTNTDTGLHAKTVKASLGEVDAFLSHSWHDDADQKWGALEKWSGDKGKTSTVWLDKACINQQMIDESLAALPVYLSGCKELLVVAGATYTTRLWCVMELFVWIQMGGDLERVSAIALPGRDVHAALATFDAAKATCFKPEDRQHLLGIIESAFGDFNSFNVKVRSLFKKRATTTELKKATQLLQTTESVVV